MQQITREIFKNCHTCVKKIHTCAGLFDFPFKWVAFQKPTLPLNHLSFETSTTSPSTFLMDALRPHDGGMGAPGLGNNRIVGVLWVKIPWLLGGSSQVS